ncbi:tetratricopeptide repeat protein [Polaribacter marinivivus]|uniref:Tetratricopeptide repeat protein n=1 Tax=Polaribacter marinivivus TaxID=1524260 RepID=A0ABV8RA04_9FLAO
MALFYLFFILFSLKTVSQDSIPEQKDLTEEAELKFQQYFFKALSQKSIGNYSKAIENLEDCNQILQENTAVFFEFSKNYLALNKTLLAKEYINRALVKKPDNIWMLKHLVEIYVKERNYSKAIDVQQKVITQNPKEKEYLVRLFLYNREYKKAVDLMNALENDKALSTSLKMLKQSLEARKNISVKTESPNDVSTLKKSFENEKSYKTLEKILKLSNDNINDLLKYSKLGIELYPSQSFVYLINGKALNMQKEYKNALLILQNGIDFVIEDNMEIDFYKEIAKAYKGLGNIDQENKYIKKAKQLKS